MLGEELGRLLCSGGTRDQRACALHYIVFLIALAFISTFGLGISLFNQAHVNTQSRDAVADEIPSVLIFWFVVTRFIAYLRENRMNAVTTNKNTLKQIFTGY